ncbi:ketose-bisphosphate aldolase [Kineococcus sp. NPDC059986]|uniref:ketose-bisphosphate aldolase n=1 Tax=Kineococcus sp. NPDC059986 TaxID=3155538 RepID=UPI00344DA339
MLINGNDLLSVANSHDFAVPAFNISDWAMLLGIIAVSEEEDSPLIVAIHPDELRHITTDAMPSIVRVAERAKVPVTIHLDHGASYEQALLAIQCGFTSVMIDASMLPFEENAAVVRRVVEAAHAVGLSVEGELGTIGKTDGYAEAGSDDIIYTKPAEAARFVAETGVDSLAIAIGTRHGLYPSSLKPELKLDLLAEIKEAAPLPLVLHGGSNNPDDEIGRSVTLGINKINISSDIKVAYHRAVRGVLEADEQVREPNVVQPPALAAMKVVAAQKIHLFEAAGKASLY